MALKIFGGETGEAPAKKKFSDDIVGRFRSGHQVSQGRRMVPVALQEWRVTTGDPAVADAIANLLDAKEGPAEWDASGEDNLEVFTSANSVDVILAGKNPLRERMILWGRNGKVIYESDGQNCTDGSPDPDAALSLKERKAKAKNGTGPEPQVEIFFRLADAPDLGIFKFQSGSWSLVQDIAYHRTAEKIEEILEDGGQVAASLSIEEVEFVAKNGPRAGETVRFYKPVLRVKGAAE